MLFALAYKGQRLFNLTMFADALITWSFNNFLWTVVDFASNDFKTLKICYPFDQKVPRTISTFLTTFFAKQKIGRTRAGQFSFDISLIQS